MRSLSSVVLPGSLLALIFLLPGCGGGSNDVQPPPPPPRINSVTISGGGDRVGANGELWFNVAVTGTGSFNSAVTWSVNEVGGGNTTLGTISNTGYYHAPEMVPSPATVTIKATSVGDATKYATTSVRIVPYVQVSPMTWTQMEVGGSYQFAADVYGINDGSLKWFVNGIEGGNSTIGTVVQTSSSPRQSISTYTAPLIRPSDALELRAVSVADSEGYATWPLTVHLKIAISPSSPKITCGESLQFTATVEGAVDKSVSWTVRNGTITSDGFYTAPRGILGDEIRVEAAAEPGWIISQPLQLTPLRPIIRAISPQPAASGQQLTVTGENFYGGADVYWPEQRHIVSFRAVDGSILDAPGFSYSPNEIQVTVPVGAATGPVNTRIGDMIYGYYPDTPMSAEYPFIRLPRLRLHAKQHELGSGESIALDRAILGGATTRAIQYTTNKGTVDASGVYIAPTVETDDEAMVTGCFEGTEVCDTVRLALRPFSTRPIDPVIASGQSILMSTEPKLATEWKLLAGGGTMLSNGLFNAGMAWEDGGGIVAGATYGSRTQEAVISVTGSHPGLVKRVMENLDPYTIEPPFDGSMYVNAVAQTGTRLFVLTNMPSRSECRWIDYYDISNPIEPVWMGAFETPVGANATGQLVHAYGKHLTIADPNKASLWVYDVTVDPPQPVLHTAQQILSNSEGLLYGIDCSMNSTCDDHVRVGIVDLRQGVPVQQWVDLPVEGMQTVTSIAGDGGLIFMLYQDTALQPHLASFDINTTPATEIDTQTLSGSGFDIQLVGERLLVLERNDANGLGTEVFSIAGGQLQPVTFIPGMRAIVDTEGDKWLVSAGLSQMRLMDMADVLNPQVHAVIADDLFGGDLYPYSFNEGPDLSRDAAQLVGNYVYVASGGGGLSVWDVSVAGGGYTKGYMNPGWMVVWDLARVENFLYAASDWSYDIYDTATTPANLVGSWPTNDAPSAVEVSGNYLFAGMDYSLQVLDISTPGSPRSVATLATSIRSMALKGTTLYTGIYPTETAPARVNVYDVSVPTNPRLVTSVTPQTVPSTIIAMQVHGNLLLMTTVNGMLFIYDITQPQSPVLRSTFTISLSSAAYDVAADGNLVFVAGDWSGLVIIDISNPSAPKLVSRSILPNSVFNVGGSALQACAVALNGGTAYVGSCDGKIFGYDYASPSHPRLTAAIADFPPYVFYPGDEEYGRYYTFMNSMLFAGTDLFVGGFMYTASLAQMDFSRPRNAIYPLTLYSRIDPKMFELQSRARTRVDIKRSLNRGSSKATR